MKFAPVCQKKEWGRKEKEAHAQIWFFKRQYSQPLSAEIIMGIIRQGLSFIITPNKAYIHQNIS
jgi:hypothetical protein